MLALEHFHDHRLVALRHLGLGLHDVDGRHGADLHARLAQLGIHDARRAVHRFRRLQQHARLAARRVLRRAHRRPARVAQLLHEIWGYDYFGGTRTVDVHIRRLRAKLGPEFESVIDTVRNVGYKFNSANPLQEGILSEK